MQEDFLTRIRSSYNQFTKAERRVADFILQNPNKVLFMSISDLAETCDVGDTSVFRFCKTMNVKGYQEFKMTLSLSMRGKEKAEGLEDNGEVTLGDSISDLAAKGLQDTISSILFWIFPKSAWRWTLCLREDAFFSLVWVHRCLRL